MPSLADFLRYCLAGNQVPSSETEVNFAAKIVCWGIHQEEYYSRAGCGYTPQKREGLISSQVLDTLGLLRFCKAPHRSEMVVLRHHAPISHVLCELVAHNELSTPVSVCIIGAV